MAIYEIYSQSVSFKYKSTLCSKSTIFSVITTVLTVVLPFLLAYRSHGFWLRSSSYREQPQVHFKHQYLLYLETDLPDSPILCSNLPLTQDYDYCTVIKSREEDFNQDGWYDELVMDIAVEVPSNLSVYSAQIVLIFDYVLQKYCLLQMEAAGYIQFNSGLPFSSLEVTGDLRLIQKQLLKSGTRDTRYNSSVFDLRDDPTLMYNLQEAVRKYGKREVSARIQNVYQTSTQGVVLNAPFTISLNIMYTEETIYYSPCFWQIMKWAWIQYLALLIISAYVFRSVKSYVFSNHLVPTLKEIPWSKHI